MQEPTPRRRRRACSAEAGLSQGACHYLRPASPARPRLPRALGVRRDRHRVGKHHQPDAHGSGPHFTQLISGFKPGPQPVGTVLFGLAFVLVLIANASHTRSGRRERPRGRRKATRRRLVRRADGIALYIGLLILAPAGHRRRPEAGAERADRSARSRRPARLVLTAVITLRPWWSPPCSAWWWRSSARDRFPGRRLVSAIWSTARRLACGGRPAAVLLFGNGGWFQPWSGAHGIQSVRGAVDGPGDDLHLIPFVIRGRAAARGAARRKKRPRRTLGPRGCRHFSASRSRTSDGVARRHRADHGAGDWRDRSGPDRQAGRSRDRRRPRRRTSCAFDEGQDPSAT